MNKENKIIAYKGFDKDLKCRGFQYKIGKTYKKNGKIKVCENGFHSCENPFDVFGYYDPATSRFAEVEASGKVEHSEDKIACSKLKIKAEIGLSGLIGSGVKFILDKVDFKKALATNTGDSSAATNTGYRSAATNTGDSSAATNTGFQSAATNTGYRSAATNTGDSSAATNTGYQSAATNTGDSSAATNTGDSSAATNTGYRSAATNTGDSSAATVEGKESIACGLGYNNIAKGAKGCWLVLAEREDYENDYKIKYVKAVKVDGKIIKANTFYRLRNGNFEEVK